MVQIIQVCSFIFSKTSLIFISHMVQIIPYYYNETHRVHIALYIPHGSDNTLKHVFQLLLPLLFISHMVQIIQTQESMVDLNILLFISHMVQIIL